MAPQRGGPRFRSILVASPRHADWLLGAKKLGADGIMMDLEDMVPMAGKREARALASDVIGQLKGPRLTGFVRLNSWMPRLNPSVPRPARVARRAGGSQSAGARLHGSERA
jgi:hypothetical protein